MFDRFKIRLDTRNSATYTMNYYSMLWLLVAQLVVMIPFLFYLPVWLLPIMLFSTGWRFRVLQGHASPPTLRIKTVMFVFGGGALFISGLPLVSLDMMAAFLLLSFAYKVVEVVARRDALIVIFTGYLLVAVQFLYSQSLVATLYGVFSLITLTAALISLQQETIGVRVSMFFNIRLSAFILTACLPLMVILFFLVPRFPPLWTMPSPAGEKAKTGITDHMTPGDIADLTQSDELVFRVQFENKVPVQKELYWRGLVLSHFDGKTWTSFKKSNDVVGVVRENKALISHLDDKDKVRVRYDVIFEASGQSWLFTLPSVNEIIGQASVVDDDRIVAKQALIEPLALTFSSVLNEKRDVILSEERYGALLQLPLDGNMRSKQFAQRLYKASNSKEIYVKNVLQHFQQQDFVYTLKPSMIVDDNTIDTFLFEQKKGFCAHYASSFVFLMRAVGIPARVVVGYQGGEWNEKARYLAIRQYDAHAWAEVWIKNKGWVRQDPTAIVAPDRIEKNLETAVENEGSFLQDKPFSMAKMKWLSGVRKNIDALQYGWRRWVLGYDEQAQASLLERLFKGKNVLSILLYGIIISIFLVLSWRLYLRFLKPDQHPYETVEHRLYRRFCMLIQRFLGLKRASYQTPNDFALYVTARHPELTDVIDDFTLHYLAFCYEPREKQHERHDVRLLRRHFYQLLWALIFYKFNVFFQTLMNNDVYFK